MYLLDVDERQHMRSLVSLNLCGSHSSELVIGRVVPLAVQTFFNAKFKQVKRRLRLPCWSHTVVGSTVFSSCSGSGQCILFGYEMFYKDSWTIQFFDHLVVNAFLLITLARRNKLQHQTSTSCFLSYSSTQKWLWMFEC